MYGHPHHTGEWSAAHQAAEEAAKQARFRRGICWALFLSAIFWTALLLCGVVWHDLAPAPSVTAELRR